MAEGTCVVDGCGQKHYGRGYCMPHYNQWRRRPDSDTGRQCSIDGCACPHYARGWCRAHYARWAKGLPLDAPFVSRRASVATYSGIHSRLRKLRGPASAHQCQHCGDPARHWAYDHDDPNELWGKHRSSDDPMPYSIDLDHYLPLCSKCHSAFDRKMARARLTASK